MLIENEAKNSPAFRACNCRIGCHRRADQRAESLKSERIGLLQDRFLWLRSEHR